LPEQEAATGMNDRIFLCKNFTIKAIRNLLPESFYSVLNVQYETEGSI